MACLGLLDQAILSFCTPASFWSFSCCPPELWGKPASDARAASYRVYCRHAQQDGHVRRQESECRDVDRRNFSCCLPTGSCTRRTLDLQTCHGICKLSSSRTLPGNRQCQRRGPWAGGLATRWGMPECSELACQMPVGPRGGEPWRLAQKRCLQRTVSCRQLLRAMMLLKAGFSCFSYAKVPPAEAEHKILPRSCDMCKE